MNKMIVTLSLLLVVIASVFAAGDNVKLKPEYPEPMVKGTEIPKDDELEQIIKSQKEK